MKLLISSAMICCTLLGTQSCDSNTSIDNTSGVVSQQPTLDFSEKGRGCSSFIVYKYSSDQTVAISVSGSREGLNLSLQEQRFDIANNERLSVKIREFADRSNNFFCDDILGNEPQITRIWNGIDGQAEIVIIEDSVDVQPWQTPYRLTVRLSNVILRNDAGETLTLETIDFTDVLVGWLPG